MMTINPEKSSDHDVIYALRTIHQSQTQLVILADQKANILIGIVAVVLTIICTKAGFLIDLDRYALIPIAAFIVLEIAALLFALLVIMPKATKISESMTLETIPNPLFFGFFTQFSQAEYIDHIVNKLDSDKSSRYFIIKDLYQVGCVLKKKYTLLRYAYISTVMGVIFLMIACLAFLASHSL